LPANPAEGGIIMENTNIVNTEEIVLTDEQSAVQPDGQSAAVTPESPAVAAVAETEQAFCTPIQAADRLGKLPQHVYGLLRNKKVPAEHIKLWPKGDGTMRELLYESFFSWHDSRGNFRGNAVSAPTKSAPVTIIQAAPVIDYDKILVMMATKLESANNPKFKGLAEALKSAMATG
jgi:hypothetical protein